MAPYHVAARTLIVVLGLAAVAWGGFFLPLFWQQAPAKTVTSEVLQGHTFKTQSLLDEVRQLAAVDQFPFCNPTGLHDAVVLQLAVLDELTRANRSLIGSADGSLNDVTRTALACSPADPFAWLTLFWLDSTKRGPGPENESFLRLSYASGPNEAWVALWRNRLAIAVFDRLPTDLADAAIDEFVKLVDTGALYRETAEIFASASPDVQRRIIAQLAAAQTVPRQIFARTLSERGLDVDIPGVEKPTRPWH